MSKYDNESELTSYTSSYLSKRRVIDILNNNDSIREYFRDGSYVVDASYDGTSIYTHARYSNGKSLPISMSYIHQMDWNMNKMTIPSATEITPKSVYECLDYKYKTEPKNSEVKKSENKRKVNICLCSENLWR